MIDNFMIYSDILFTNIWYLKMIKVMTGVRDVQILLQYILLAA